MVSRSDLVASAALAGVIILVGVPVALTQVADEAATVGPWWVWWLCYAAYIGCLVATVWIAETGASRHDTATWCGIVALMVTGIGLYLMADQGWTAILLVITAAIAAHYRSPGPVVAVVALQTLAIPIPSIPHAPLWELLLGAAIYGGLQMLSVAAVWIQLRETDMRRELAVANTELRATTALLAESSRTAERLRISRELHDVIGHQLTALALELEVAGHRSGPPVSEHVVRARGLATDLLEEIRSAVGGLRDHQPPLRAALDLIVADLPRPRVHLEVADEIRLDETQTVTVIRCVQEIVTNTIRHSGAANLWIGVVHDEPGEVALTAHDDGRGRPDYHPGNGLAGMRERFEQLDGRVTIHASDGFRIDARMPVR